MFGNEENDFSNHPPQLSPDQITALDGETFDEADEAMVQAIKTRIGYYFENGRPFDGGTVLDVGSGDGRFLQMIKELGAKKVIPIEPDIYGLSEVAIQRLRIADLFHGTIEDLEMQNGGKYDGALVLNCSPTADAKTLVESLSRQIKEGCTVIFSFAEKKPTYDHFLPIIQQHFRGSNPTHAVSFCASERRTIYGQPTRLISLHSRRGRSLCLIVDITTIPCSERSKMPDITL